MRSDVVRGSCYHPEASRSSWLFSSDSTSWSTLLLLFLFANINNNFYPFTVAFDVGEHPQDELVPVSTFVVEVINNSSLTGLSLFHCLEVNKKKEKASCHVTKKLTSMSKNLMDRLHHWPLENSDTGDFFQKACPYRKCLHNICSHLCAASTMQVPVNELLL